MSKIVAARARLSDVFTKLEDLQKETADTLEWALREITLAQQMMIRESPTRRARPGPRLTAKDAAKIRRYAKRHPKATFQAIAIATGIGNTGRVSEVLSGKRFNSRTLL